MHWENFAIGVFSGFTLVVILTVVWKAVLRSKWDKVVSKWNKWSSG